MRPMPQRTEILMLFLAFVGLGVLFMLALVGGH